MTTVLLVLHFFVALGLIGLVLLQRSEGDELIEAIEHDQDEANWTLDNTPDVQGLDEFWTTVEDDLKKDPDWFDFAED